MNEPLGYTYHSHTKRCGHAVGEDVDYVKKAIEGHYQILGFSDHVMLPGVVQPGMRGDYLLAQPYFQSVRSLKEQYASSLTIYLAFEAEWYGLRYEDYYHSLLEKEKLDYLLLGQHCFLDGNQPRFYGTIPDKKAATKRYVDDLIAGMKSGLFAYVCHPDLFMSWYGPWDSYAEIEARRIVQAAKDLHMILEVNMGPSRWGRRNAPGKPIEVPYPYPAFWDIVSSAGVSCIIGVDDHNPLELINSPFDWVRLFVKEHHLNEIDRLDLPRK